MIQLFRKLFRHRPMPMYRVGDAVRYGGRAMAISCVEGDAAEIIWIDKEGSLHTRGFVPMSKLERTAR